MKKLMSLLLILTLLMNVLPMTALATLAPIPLPEFGSGLDAVIRENSPELEKVLAFTETPGYGSNGKFSAPIPAPDPAAIPIYTAQDLYDIRNDLSASYVLMNDIDLFSFNGGQWVPIGNSSNRFRGAFDGQGYVIRNLSIIGNTYSYAGLFAEIEGADIRNTGFENTLIEVNSSAYLYAGGICATGSGTIINCYNTGRIATATSSGAASYAGGICGDGSIKISFCYNRGNIFVDADSRSFAGGISGSNDGSILDCFNAGDIFASSPLGFAANGGGICGQNSTISRVSSCQNSGNISVISNYSYGGGICGASSSANYIAQCSNTGNISSTFAGGICGTNSSPIYDCYNDGDITSNGEAGGIFAIGSGWLNCCYNRGNISAWYSAGGICGVGNIAYISQCYNAGTIFASSFSHTYAGGIAGNGTVAINDCFNAGNISAHASADPYAGGIIGFDDNGDIINCYNAGNVLGSGVSFYAANGGGISAYSSAAINNCLTLSNQVFVESALLADNISSFLISSGTSKYNNLALENILGNAIDDSNKRITRFQAESQATYEALGWDFDNIWFMVPDFNYPQLRALPPAGLQEKAAFTVQVVNSNLHGVIFNGQRTLVSAFEVRANEADLILNNNQGLRLAYYNSILQLIKWDASAAIADPLAGDGFNYPAAGGGNAGVLGGTLTVFNAVSADSKTGYLSLGAGDHDSSFACPLAEFVTLGEVRFAFREGKSAADLKDDSIWIMTTAELNDLTQTYAVLLNTDQGLSYPYGTQFEGTALPELDKLAQPAIIWELSNGVGLSGMIRSYDPKKPTTVCLRQGATDVYTTTVADPSGWGQAEQRFSFKDVAPGTYSLVITKDLHTKFIIETVIVGGEDLDLSKDSRPEVAMMTLRCGDINGDGLINDADLTVLWRVGNYNKRVGVAENPGCDLNGDGLINDADLTILWLAYNYNRGAIIII